MNCEIIKDLLPLYNDGVCSDESAMAVEEHLTGCSACRALLDEMRRELAVPEPIQVQARQEAEVLRGVRRKFSMRRRLSMLAVSVAALAAMAVLTAASDVEKPIPYQEGLIAARLAVDEAISIDFFGKHNSSFLAFSRETAEGYAIYFCCTQTFKSSINPLPEENDYICIGNGLMTDFATASYQVPRPQEINAVYYLEASQREYLYLPRMSDEDFTQKAQDAVLLWKR